ncbi:MAG: hypothetical protein LBG65_05495 [Puniceicoccales bacterium]|nr:hypothetical protein [Puniceicoccales bacterium]
METISHNEETLQRWQLGASTFTANVQRGARLQSWVLKLPTTSRNVIYWPENPDMSDYAGIRGGNPILFPFCGRCYADGQRFFWSDPDGKIRPMPLHGIARQGRFSIVSASKNTLDALFHPSPDANEAYPFTYAFNVRYTFAELALECDLVLRNDDTRPIPWAPGHHPYFGLPWHPGLARADYQASIPAKKIWRHAADGKLAPHPGLASLQPDFADPGLSDAIHTRLRTNIVTFGPRSGEENISLQIGEDSVPDARTTCVTWTAAPDSPFYCVEPWAAPPNAPALKNGLRWVPPGATDTFHIRISLD